MSGGTAGSGGTGNEVNIPSAGMLEPGGGSAGTPEETCGGEICSPGQECQPMDGGGFHCVDAGCEDDVGCPEAQYCLDGSCVDDECEPGAQRCDGHDLLLCLPNGSGEETAYVCENSSHFESICDLSPSGVAGCRCEDDWDCPGFTECDAGTCTGTGVAPSCTLPPQPFDEVLPSVELHWGGESSADPDAGDSPFPESSQVVSTPIVANLDDDNGDGLINENDFPEILFITYHRDDDDGVPGGFGVVRAIHGGGPDKGSDYFALCGDGGTGLDQHWLEGEDASSVDCGADFENALARPAGALAVGDLDDDGVPEIVVPTVTGGLQILDNQGVPLLETEGDLWPAGLEWTYPAPAIANLDHDGLAEIVVGARVVTLDKNQDDELVVAQVFAGQQRSGVQDRTGPRTRHFGPVVCVADLTEEFEGLEVVAGTSAYRLPDPADCDDAPNSDYCQGELTLLWDAQDVNGTTSSGVPDGVSEGFCAVADVLTTDDDGDTLPPDPDHPLDGQPEVVVIANGNVLILDGATGRRRFLQDIRAGIVGAPDASTDGIERGGAPNIDDFDGDGFPEIATALRSFYAVVDLQEPATACPEWDRRLGPTEDPPGTNQERSPGVPCSSDDDCDSGECNPDTGQCACTENGDCQRGAFCIEDTGTCACLHNGWIRDTEDDSSKATSSSVFDFNGDGAAEVVYNDECYFRVYDGATGAIRFEQPSLSRTIIENPVVADVDNDGNAEIVTVTNTLPIQCDQDPLRRFEGGTVAVDSLPNGVNVWGDASDTWVSARRVWNQHSYHVTNVTESGGIPLHEPESWLDYGGRTYNTYRSQPRSFGVAPDLVATAIQVSSPGAACGDLGDEIVIVVAIKNQGDLRVGPGVEVSFDGIWTDPDEDEPLLDDQGEPLAVTLDKSLAPGSVTLVEVSYDVANGSRDDLPTEVRATVDSSDLERECLEDNNAIVGPVAGDEVADLRLVIDDAEGCMPPMVEITVYNDGAAPAQDVLVRIYAGDPSQGGQAIGEVTIAGPIEPGESASATVTTTDLTRDVTVYGIADPLDAIPECNEANNLAEGPILRCALVPR